MKLGFRVSGVWVQEGIRAHNFSYDWARNSRLQGSTTLLQNMKLGFRVSGVWVQEEIRAHNFFHNRAHNLRLQGSKRSKVDALSLS